MADELTPEMLKEDWKKMSARVRSEARTMLFDDVPPAWVWRSYFNGELSGRAAELMREICVAYPEVTRLFLPPG